MFRGREQSRPELGFRLLQRLAADVQELGFVESAPKQDGRNMIMVLGPHKKKAEARAERAADKARRDEAAAGDAEAADRVTRSRDRADGRRPTSHRVHRVHRPGPRRVRRPAGLAGTTRTSPRPPPAASSHPHDSRPTRAHRGERREMPKNKTHSGTKKRFRLTGTGKVMREQANRRHLLENKSSTRTRRLAADVVTSSADVKKVKRLLGK